MLHIDAHISTSSSDKENLSIRIKEMIAQLYSSQVSRLTANLAQVAQTNLGDASLFALIDYLQSEALQPDTHESIISFDIDCNQLTESKEAAQELYNALVSQARDETEKHFASATEHT